jgi:elongation factor 3
MKQTRALSEADRAQMDKWVDLKDGKSARQVESLVGRQKYKKTFQYEV